MANRLARLPGRAAPAQLRHGKPRPDLPARGIDRNPVPVAQRGDGPPHRRLGRNMSDHETMAAAGEAAIGDKSHLVRRDRRRRLPPRGGLSISRMPGPPTGPSLRIDDDITSTHAPGKNGCGRLFLAVEDPGSPAEVASPSSPRSWQPRPSGATFPYKTTRWLSFFWSGATSGRTMSWPAIYDTLVSARFSAIVRPVTVRQSPCRRPTVEQHFHERLDCPRSPD